MDGRIFTVVDGDDGLQEDSVWADVSSESGDESGDDESGDDEAIHVENISEEQLLAINRANQIKPFKSSKLNKIYSLFLMVALVIILAYLDYVNEFQIKKLISNFQITPKSNWADAKAMCSRNSVKQVDVVVNFIEKDKTDLQCISKVESNEMERKKIHSKSTLNSYFHNNVIQKEKRRSS